ncbi:HDIG domain-containing metalloprotein [Actinomadura citrea]|uniref:Putative nucleotidyltransferase with HDIG domain n=1 Tax=Actinomadura citrea TaxID=46158 RepID=A0A7Y9KBG5_9ACTN|nr:HDIG domain-containing metalloprotein [Actinomadura citrea]NYE12907.1 putative nucleotidyltransferase with HDIG domain [Actinomadura citrea]GGT89887.1 phosphohydrolase [Actinomadura citrea]
MPSPILRRALTEPGLRPLPERAARLLEDLDAPPRLAAHLRAVHDVAAELVDWMSRRHPGLAVDAEAVLFGAATHDIGKALHPAELSGPGAEHERAGHGLLRERGVEERLARFARTHASWDDPGIGVDDLLVSLADAIWKAERVTRLEQRLVEVLAAASGQAEWEAFMDLDDICDRIAAGADGRLAFQSAYPAAGGTESIA